ncbi:5884_t:CDS:2 [Ambispora gerdemannii]|uniref:5884_t:CDS:1 n=1 Tax=Ambispora gerdemannii TaxID=144530 RepID=A0A9N9D665_9GLOM|nr:5884_t:CDS:2 [Ambispora gerdemannii]
MFETKASQEIPKNAKETYDQDEDYKVPILNWEQVREIIEWGRLELLMREKKVTTEYRRFRKEKNREYGTIDNYVRKKILNWSDLPENPQISGAASITVNNSFSTDNTASHEQHPTSQYFYAEVPPTHYALLENDFPYAIEPSIKHFILWSKLAFTPGSMQEVDRFLRAQFPWNKEWLFCVNPPHLQSVQGVSHAHVFVRDVSSNFNNCENDQTDEKPMKMSNYSEII